FTAQRIKWLVRIRDAILALPDSAHKIRALLALFCQHGRPQYSSWQPILKEIEAKIPAYFSHSEKIQAYLDLFSAYENIGWSACNQQDRQLFYLENIKSEILQMADSLEKLQLWIQAIEIELKIYSMETAEATLKETEKSCEKSGYQGYLALAVGTAKIFPGQAKSLLQKAMNEVYFLARDKIAAKLEILQAAIRIDTLWVARELETVLNKVSRKSGTTEIYTQEDIAHHVAVADLYLKLGDRNRAQTVLIQCEQSVRVKTERAEKNFEENKKANIVNSLFKEEKEAERERKLYLQSLKEACQQLQECDKALIELIKHQARFSGNPKQAQDRLEALQHTIESRIIKESDLFSTDISNDIFLQKQEGGILCLLDTACDEVKARQGELLSVLPRYASDFRKKLRLIQVAASEGHVQQAYKAIIYEKTVVQDDGTHMQQRAFFPLAHETLQACTVLLKLTQSATQHCLRVD
ncbi:MAG: hypothetical protein JSS62_06600, partial [Verrucomicrobia bacterium]|nr:hypothetical protein [Verrucomicrobiota bacterium]